MNFCIFLLNYFSRLNFDLSGSNDTDLVDDDDDDDDDDLVFYILSNIIYVI